MKLIKTGDAFVCHQQADELKGHETRADSPWKNRSIEDNLLLFEDMKNGKIDEGKATLRMKHTMKDGKLDPVAYRIKFTEHHRTKDKWCIYPTYDYTHCLVDSMEDISHSLCTKEFQNRRPSCKSLSACPRLESPSYESCATTPALSCDAQHSDALTFPLRLYPIPIPIPVDYWLCNAVDVYCPVQWEYSRLNVSYAVVSKRKIAKLIDGGFVSDWDDPRLMTLSALKRRGFPAEAITRFCEKIGVTESTETTIDPSNVEASVREVMDEKCPRAMAVLQPIRVELTEVPEGFPSTVTVPNHPKDASLGSHTVSACKVLFIEREDFEAAGGKDFKRLSLKQPVGLKYLNMIIKVQKVIEENGVVTGLVAQGVSQTPENKPKAWIHWVSSASPAVKPKEAEVRCYKRLFLHPEPEKHGFLDDVNPDSLTTYSTALVDDTVNVGKVGDSFQFERSGFYCIDRDSTPEKTVFNLTVELRASK